MQEHRSQNQYHTDILLPPQSPIEDVCYSFRSHRQCLRRHCRFLHEYPPDFKEEKDQLSPLSRRLPSLVSVSPLRVSRRISPPRVVEVQRRPNSPLGFRDNDPRLQRRQDSPPGCSDDEPHLPRYHDSLRVRCFRDYDTRGQRASGFDRERDHGWESPPPRDRVMGSPHPRDRVMGSPPPRDRIMRDADGFVIPPRDRRYDDRRPELEPVQSHRKVSVTVFYIFYQEQDI